MLLVEYWLTCSDMGNGTNPRTAMVEELIWRVKAYKFVTVRGTPASDKTTVMRLLCNRLFLTENLPIHVLINWRMEVVEAVGSWEEFLGRRWLSYPAFLLLDEAQEGNWDSEVWAAFFKSIEKLKHGPSVILFSSYGSPGGGYTGLDLLPVRSVKTSMG